MLIQTLTVGQLQTNCYLLCDEKSKTCAIIDPGAEGQRVAARMAQSGYTPTAILLTHGHFDQCAGAAAAVSRSSGVPAPQ